MSTNRPNYLQQTYIPSFVFCTFVVDDADTCSESVLCINWPSGFRVKIIPVSSKRTGQPFRTFSLQSWAFSQALVISCSLLSSFAVLAIRVWFSFCSTEERLANIELIFLDASPANLCTMSVCRDESGGRLGTSRYKQLQLKIKSLTN